MTIIRINLPDDSGDYQEINFTVKDGNGRELGSNREYNTHFTRGGEIDPVTSSIMAIMPSVLWMPTRRHWYDDSPEDWVRNLTVNGLSILIERNKTRYRVMGKMVNKSIMLRAVSKVLFRAAQGASVSELFATLQKNLDIPDNVAYALENRAPYYWFDEYNKIKVSLNVQVISKKTCAIEISDGVWAEIKTNDMNSFLNFYRHGKKNSSWKNLSPKRLWTKLMGEEPSEGQLKLMKAFLLQNRTQDLVEKRAKQLMQDLGKQYPDRIKIREEEDRTKMFVRGKLADWILTDKGMKAGYQMVNTYVYRVDEGTDLDGQTSIQNGYQIGPICIDNVSNNSPLGDQFATRAIALMNDVITVLRVNTVRNYVPEKLGYVEGQIRHRMNWDEL